jgi:hypothetical protein
MPEELRFINKRLVHEVFMGFLSIRESSRGCQQVQIPNVNSQYLTTESAEIPRQLRTGERMCALPVHPPRSRPRDEADDDKVRKSDPDYEDPLSTMLCAMQEQIGDVYWILRWIYFVEKILRWLLFSPNSFLRTATGPILSCRILSIRLGNYDVSFYFT